MLRNNEKKISDKIQSLINQTRSTYAYSLSKFLNPREQMIAEDMVTPQADLNIYHFGGYPHSERQRIIISPEYLPIQKSEFEIKLFNIKFNTKFIRLEHGQILGTLANSGIDRDIFGDIITDQIHWQFYAEAQFSDYITNEITRIGHHTVKIEEVSNNNRVLVYDDSNNETEIVGSLRLDSLVATVFKLSRRDAKSLILSGSVLVNWNHEKRSDYLLTIRDTVSVHGKGRFTILDLLGQTQAQKYRIYVKVYRR